MNALSLSLLTILAGTTIVVQAGINSQLQKTWAVSPVLASLVSFAVGTLAMLVCILFTRTPFPPLAGKFTAWQWSGGLLGAFFVTLTVYAAPRLGAVSMLVLLLAGQMAGALALDQFGLLGYPQKSISALRLLGLALVGCGVFLIRKF